MSRKQKIILVLIVLVVVGAGVASLMLLRNGNTGKDVKSANSLKILKSNVIGLITQRDPSLVQKTVSKDNQQTGQLWALTHPKASQQEFVIDANYEQGDSLKKLTGYTKQSLRDSVVANVNIQLPKQYPHYKELTQRNLTVNGFEANETIFEYVTSGVKIRQRLLLLFKNSDTAVYIRAQAKVAEYKKVSIKYFEPIFSSAKFE